MMACSFSIISKLLACSICCLLTCKLYFDLSLAKGHKGCDLHLMATSRDLSPMIGKSTVTYKEIVAFKCLHHGDIPLNSEKY